MSLLQPKAIALAATMTLLASTTALADELFPRSYVGAALGQSTLKPRANTKQTDNNDIGLKVFLGYDFSPRMSAEFHAAKLGEASYVNDAALSYQTYGAEALYNVYSSREYDGLEYREGVIAYVKGGLGIMRNKSLNMSFGRENDWHISIGAGVAFDFLDNLRARLEYNAYDKDAHYLNLAGVFRFGDTPAWPFGNRKPSIQVVQQPVMIPQPARPAPVVAPRPIPAPPKIKTIPPSDVDADGVDDREDLCPATPAGRRVDESGCVFGGILEGVKFKVDSATLTLPAKARLDAVIQDMQRYPKLRVQITAHTDNQGSGNYNRDLSIKRALSVAEYLIGNGISPDRLRAVGAGESQPIYRNDSESGRQGNRRVDFKVLSY